LTDALALEQARKFGRAVHRLALRQIKQDRGDIGILTTQIDTMDDVGFVLLT
jgi:hypothetical protein